MVKYSSNGSFICDNPCELQREDYTPFNEEDGVEPLIDLIKWMGNKLNKLISENELLYQNNVLNALTINKN